MSPVAPRDTDDEGRGGGAVLRRHGRPDEWHGTGTNYYDSLAAVLAEWADAVRAGRAPAASLAEGVRDVAVMAAIAESAARAAPVSVAPTATPPECSSG